MTDDQEGKIRRFTAIPGGKKTSGSIPGRKKVVKATGKPKRPGEKRSANARNQIYVTDTRFHKAMDLIRNDMNKAFQVGNIANTQYYFLVRFLIQKGLVDETEFTRFLEGEMKKLEEGQE
ncbi:MAG: hypothetical protein HZA78_06835 [Candidatus Schekmanbacteria bacterium]|nr:hypothetical protein [Candidatus Schekmanbacteria bacterium]